MSDLVLGLTAVYDQHSDDILNKRGGISSLSADAINRSLSRKVRTKIIKTWFTGKIISRVYGSRSTDL